jgi:hypothetical protein
MTEASVPQLPRSLISCTVWSPKRPNSEIDMVT